MNDPKTFGEGWLLLWHVFNADSFAGWFGMWTGATVFYWVSECFFVGVRALFRKSTR